MIEIETGKVENELPIRCRYCGTTEWALFSKQAVYQATVGDILGRKRRPVCTVCASSRRTHRVLQNRSSRFSQMLSSISLEIGEGELKPRVINPLPRFGSWGSRRKNNKWWERSRFFTGKRTITAREAALDALEYVGEEVA